MPAIPSSLSHNVARRSSFYGRGRVSSSGSSSSSTHQRSQSGGSSAAASSSSYSAASTTATTSKTSSSSAQRSSSPLSKKQAAVAAAANAASKRLQLVNAVTAATAAASSTHVKMTKSSVEQLRRDAVSCATLDEPEYQSEVIDHMHRMETDTIACVDLMDAQPELRWYMRPYLVDFIVEIHQTFRLRPETLYLTMNIVDRYVSKRIVYKRHYQLVGCAALLIAAKFEDAKDKVPLVSELAQMCCSAYDESAFVQMEGHVLSTIGWILGFPTPEAWLRFACASTNGAPQVDAEHILRTVSVPDLEPKTLNMTRFLLEASLFTRDFIGLPPSQLTAGCLLLARIVAANGQNREAITAAASTQAVDAAQLVDGYMIEHAHELSEILVKKYSFSHFGGASTAVVQWYSAFVAQRDAQQNGDATHSTIPTLLPAVSFSSALNTATTAASAPAMSKSSSASSFSTPRRSAEAVQDEEEDDDDDEEDANMLSRSRSTTPSSMISTPSQMSTDGEDEDEDDETDGDRTLDEDEESDMPVTPLSLNSLHDPLVATESKENGSASKRVANVSVAAAAANATAAAVAVKVASVGAEQHLQPRDDRRALALSQQDNRMLV